MSNSTATVCARESAVAVLVSFTGLRSPSHGPELPRVVLSGAITNASPSPIEDEDDDDDRSSASSSAATSMEKMKLVWKEKLAWELVSMNWIGARYKALPELLCVSSNARSSCATEASPSRDKSWWLPLLENWTKENVLPWAATLLTTTENATNTITSHVTAAAFVPESAHSCAPAARFFRLVLIQCRRLSSGISISAIRTNEITKTIRRSISEQTAICFKTRPPLHPPRSLALSLSLSLSQTANIGLKTEETKFWGPGHAHKQRRFKKGSYKGFREICEKQSDR